MAAAPAMAQGYYSAPRAAAPGYVVQNQGYGAYAYAPGPAVAGWQTGVVFQNGRYAGADPDPTVRMQLEQQADTNFNR
jgi:hypothetical protein